MVFLNVGNFVTYTKVVILLAIRQKVTTFDNKTGFVIDEKERGLYNPFDPEKGYNFKYKSFSIKSYLDIPLPDVFSDSELGKLFRLSRHIYANSNMLGKRVNTFIRPFTQEKIIEVFELKDRQGRALLKKIIDNHVIRKLEFTEQGKTFVQFYFNPIYFFSGTYLNLNLFLLFQDELNKHLPPWVIAKFLEQEEAEKNGDKSSSS